jgi:hypothetical protein
MAFVVDDPGGEALLVQVSLPPVPAIEALGVQAVQAMHPGRQPLAMRLDQKVVVGAHETPRVEPPAEHLDALLEKPPERLAVEVVPVDARTGDPA